MGGYHDLAILTFSSSVALQLVLIFLPLVSSTYKIQDSWLTYQTHKYIHISSWFHMNHTLQRNGCKSCNAATDKASHTGEWLKELRAETALAMKYIRTFDSLGPRVPTGLSQMCILYIHACSTRYMWSLWLCLAGRIVLLFLQGFCKLADSTRDLRGHK